MKRLFYQLFCLTLLACQQQNNTDAPANLIPREKMVQILADVHILEALIEANVAYPDSAVMVYNKKHKEILEKYGVTKEQFHSTYDYYGKSLENMDKLYETVLDTLSAREAKLFAANGEAGKADSLQQNNSRPNEVERARLRKGKLVRPEEVMQSAPEEDM